MADLSASFDPDSIASTSDAASSAMALASNADSAASNVGSEVTVARGSKNKLDSRLDITLNEDGTLKGRCIEYNFPAGCWNYPVSNPAPLDRDTGTNGGMFRHLFDDTTEEFILLEPAFEIPDNIDTAGTVYFSLFGYAKTADGNEVQFRLSHSSRDEGESWDNAYGTKDSGDKATDSDQDELDQIEWNETVSNLGWATQDLIRLMLSRIAIDDGTKVTGDYGVLNLKIRIPVT